jgi:hypothetical protein
MSKLILGIVVTSTFIFGLLWFDPNNFMRNDVSVMHTRNLKGVSEKERERERLASKKSLLQQR